MPLLVQWRQATTGSFHESGVRFMGCVCMMDGFVLYSIMLGYYSRTSTILEGGSRWRVDSRNKRQRPSYCRLTLVLVKALH